MRWITGWSGSFLDPFQHSCEVKLFRPDLGQVQRASEAFGGGPVVLQPPVELADHRMEQSVTEIVGFVPEAPAFVARLC